MSRALITAAADGIGAATAAAFADAGYELVLADIDGDRLASSAPAGAATFAGDVTDPGVVDELVSKAGSVDVLVNVVGGSRPGKTVVELGLDEWDDLLRLNLTSTFLLCRAVIPAMESGSGRSRPALPDRRPRCRSRPGRRPGTARAPAGSGSGRRSRMGRR